MRYLLLFSAVLILSGCSASKATNDFIFPTAEGKQKYIESYNKTLSLWGVPYQEKEVETSFGTAHVIISGPENGEPVVLFHGTDSSSTMWFPNASALSEKYRIYAIDYPVEAGKSVLNQPDLSTVEMVKFYNEVFDFFKMKNINLVAASRGGWIATYLALQPNNKVKKLILLSPAQTFGWVDKKGKALSAMALKFFPSKKRLDKFFYRFSDFPEKIDDKYKEQFYLANKYGKSKPGLTKMIKFSESKIRSLKIPVMVFVGEHDVINNAKSLDKAKELLPNAETILVKNAGHFLSIDQSELVNKKIIEFLDKN